MSAIHFLIDQNIYETFKTSLSKDRCTIPQVLRAAISSYIEGKLILQGAYLVSTDSTAPSKVVSRETLPVGRPVKEKSLIGSDKPKSKPPAAYLANKASYHLVRDCDWDADGKLIDWVDRDHKGRELKDFDFPYDTHVHGEGLPSLALDWSVSDWSGSLENVILEEYDSEREKYSEREWELEYWTFCRYCAKKFLTLNKMPKFVYNRDFIESELLTLKYRCEDMYAVMEEMRKNYENNK